MCIRDRFGIEPYHLWKDDADHAQGDWKDGVPLQPSYEQQDEIFQMCIRDRANIALALANLGVDSTFFSVVPNNSLGKSAVRWLRSNDVHCTCLLYTSAKAPC